MGTLAIGLTLSTGLVASPQLDSAAGQVFIGLLAIANALLFGYMGFDQIRGGQYAELGVP